MKKLISIIAILGLLTGCGQDLNAHWNFWEGKEFCEGQKDRDMHDCAHEEGVHIDECLDSADDRLEACRFASSLFWDSHSKEFKAKNPNRQEWVDSMCLPEYEGRARACYYPFEKCKRYAEQAYEYCTSYR